MRDYDDYDNRRRCKTAGEQLTGWLAFAAVAAVALILSWVDYHTPVLVVWFANRVAVLASAFGMAWWKRAWYAWLVFWLVVAMQLAGFIYDVFTGFSRDYMGSPVSTGATLIGLLVLSLLYLLGRLPRRRGAPAGQGTVSHVIHHHVVHGAAGAVEWTASGVPVVPAEVDGDGRPALGQSPVKAIESYAVQASAFIGRRGELAARLREMRKNRRLATRQVTLSLPRPTGGTGPASH